MRLARLIRHVLRLRSFSLARWVDQYEEHENK